MSNLKRNFSQFQNDSKQSIISTGSKKVKLNTEPNIKVYTRFRPISNENYMDTYQVDILENSIMINKSEEVIAKNGGIKKFFFSEVFDPETTQDEITRTACVPLIEDLFNHQKSSLLFTYGVTNAGKTHTIIGIKSDPGILPRSIRLLLDACDQILEGIRKGTDVEFITEELKGIKMENVLSLQNHPEYKLSNLKVCLESFEIYNEDIYDLLADAKKDKISGNLIRPKLQMKEGDNRKVYIKDLTSEEITSSTQAEAILEKCIANRSQADTLLNSNSSRSHTVFRIVLKSAYQSSLTNPFVSESSLCIVDLAGSERAKRTENVGNQMVEACNINKSLLVLGRCLKSLKEAQSGSNSNAVVPYRDSKLTRILYEYFHEENNLRMIANINPRQIDFEESMRVLNYAAIAKDIQPIKSRIDNTRKMLLPLSSKDLQKSRTEDNLSNFSAEDSLNLKGLFDDKENSIINHIGRDSFDRKDSFFDPPSDEKDVKIKVLEDMVMKLHQKLYTNEVNSRLRNVNDKFKESMRSFISNEKSSLSKALDSFTFDSTAFSSARDLNSFHLQNSFSDMFSHEVKPLNLNYYIFQGPLEERSLNGFQRAFNVQNANIHRQIHNVPPELVRSEAKDQDYFKINHIADKMDSRLIDNHIEIKEEMVEEEIPVETEKVPEIIEIQDRSEPKKVKKQNKKEKGKGKAKGKKSKKEKHELAELSGFEGLDTPELLKLTMQLDEDSNWNIPKKGRKSVKALLAEEEPESEVQVIEGIKKHPEEIEIEEIIEEKVDEAPVAKRTRGRRNKK